MPEIIKHNEPVVLVGGAPVDRDLLNRFAHLPIVAADGGVNHLRSTSLVPEVVIGDLDSIDDQEYWQSVTTVVEVKEQDTTDFEKCLYSVEAPYFIATGFSGGRLDHTLATLHVMQKLHRQKRVLLISDEDVACVYSDAVECQLPVGTRVSIYPLNRITFASSDGLLYPLDDLVMRQGQMIGTSNTSTGATVRIEPATGDGCFALILPLTGIDALLKGLS